MRRSILHAVLICSCLVLNLAPVDVFAGPAAGGKERSVVGDPSNTSRPEGMDMLAANDKNDKGGWTDPEKPIAVSPGREFTITLQSNRTTGFSWQLASPLDEAVLKFVLSDYKAPQSKLQGAGGKEIWTFRAVGRGQTTISLKYVRPWEKDVPPARTAIFKIVSE